MGPPIWCDRFWVRRVAATSSAMNEGKEPAKPSDFDARLDQALERRRGESGKSSEESGGDARKGLSIALRIGVELVAALIVGAGVGILLDRWLGTAPWLMVGFFVLGAAAGFLNVMRVMKRMDSAVGYRDRDKKPAPRIDKDDDDDED
jgi:ATP synthase protein I